MNFLIETQEAIKESGHTTEDERFGKLMELLDNLVLNARYVRNRNKCVGSEYMKVVEYVSDLILDNK